MNYGDLRAAWLDADLDGRLDLLIGSGDYPDGQYLRLYRQKEDGAFAEATEMAGFDWEGCGSLSVGDYDRDGDPDILAGRSFMRLDQAHRDKYMGGITVNEAALFRNDVGNASGNHWLTVRLVGKEAANRSGIGARISVTAGGVTQIREIRCGSGLGNHQDPPEACFGLGKATKVEKLTVTLARGKEGWADHEGPPRGPARHGDGGERETRVGEGSMRKALLVLILLSPAARAEEATGRLRGGARADGNHRGGPRLPAGRPLGALPAPADDPARACPSSTTSSRGRSTPTPSRANSGTPWRTC